MSPLAIYILSGCLYFLFVGDVVKSGYFGVITTCVAVAMAILVVLVKGNYVEVQNDGLLIARAWVFKQVVPFRSISRVGRTNDRRVYQGIENEEPSFRIMYEDGGRTKTLNLETKFMPWSEIAELLQVIRKVAPTIEIDEATRMLLENPIAVQKAWDDKWGWSSWKRAMFPGRRKHEARHPVIVPDELKTEVQNYEQRGMLESYRGKVLLIFGTMIATTLLYMVATHTFWNKGGSGIAYTLLNLPYIFLLMKKRWGFYLLALAAFADVPISLGVISAVLNLHLDTSFYVGAALTLV